MFSIARLAPVLLTILTCLLYLVPFRNPRLSQQQREEAEFEAISQPVLIDRELERQIWDTISRDAPPDSHLLSRLHNTYHVRFDDLEVLAGLAVSLGVLETKASSRYYPECLFAGLVTMEIPFLPFTTLPQIFSSLQKTRECPSISSTALARNIGHNFGHLDIRVDHPLIPPEPVHDNFLPGHAYCSEELAKILGFPFPEGPMPDDWRHKTGRIIIPLSESEVCKETLSRLPTAIHSLSHIAQLDFLILPPSDPSPDLMQNVASCLARHFEYRDLAPPIHQDWYWRLSEAEKTRYIPRSTVVNGEKRYVSCVSIPQSAAMKEMVMKEVRETFVLGEMEPSPMTGTQMRVDMEKVGWTSYHELEDTWWWTCKEGTWIMVSRMQLRWN
ncbi:hypothetical protein I350_04557 [Cryptococcus amylolentus CBS 6273]|uniref:Uncharacterized protein n=1 Tax=Cryptococcus amylolentus CBS 6273 TaxID=1296118 RepID=A0A1E3JXL9_9TREE|nr:hypothetical protein I350_04557 [Cryptococcus amylolentus CBS 6273]